MSPRVRLAEGPKHLDATTGRQRRGLAGRPGSCRCPAVPPRSRHRRGHRSRGPRRHRVPPSPSAGRPGWPRRARRDPPAGLIATSRRARTGSSAPLILHPLRFGQRHGVLDQPRGRLRQHHPARRCRRFHPLRKPDRLAGRDVAQRPRTDLAGDHPTRVQAHPQLQGHTVAVVAPRPPTDWLPPGWPARRGMREKRDPPTQLGHRITPSRRRRCTPRSRRSAAPPPSTAPAARS